MTSSATAAGDAVILHSPTVTAIYVSAVAELTVKLRPVDEEYQLQCLCAQLNSATQAHLLTMQWSCLGAETFVSLEFYVGDAGNTPSEGLSTLAVLHPGVPVMWHTHIRDLSPTAEAVRGAHIQGNELPWLFRAFVTCVVSLVVNRENKSGVSYLSALVSVRETRNIWKLIVGDSTFSLRTLKHADTWEVVLYVRCLRRREKRLDSESESERLSWREKPGVKIMRTESLGGSESERIEEFELGEVQGRCLRNPGINMMSRWRFDMRTHLAVTSWRTNTKREETKTSR